MIKAFKVTSYTIMISSAIRSQKMLFIIIWKVVKLFVMPNDITKSLKRLQFVWKAIFHSLSGLIQILLKL